MSRFEYCRLCTKLRSTTVYIFDDVGMRKMLHLKILQTLNMKVTATDPLTKHICLLCIGKLEYFDKFRLQCQDAQIYLRKKLYNDQTPEDEIVDLLEDENDSLKSSKPFKNEKNINSASLHVSSEILNENSGKNSPANVEQQSSNAVIYLKTKPEFDLDVQMEVVEEDDDDDDDEKKRDEVDIKREDKKIEFREINVSNILNGLNSEQILIKTTCETDIDNCEEHYKQDCSIDVSREYDSMDVDSVNSKVHDENITKNLSNLSVVIGRDSIDNRSRDVSKDNSSGEIGNTEISSVKVCDLDHVYDDDYDVDNDDMNDDELNCNDIGNDCQLSDNTRSAEESNKNGINDKKLNDSDVDNGCQLDDDMISAEEYSKIGMNDKELSDGDVDMQIGSSISELYLRRESMDEIKDDNTSMLLKIFHCLENLFYGKCSFMPYFVKWPRPDGSFRVGFKCFCCTKFYFTRTLTLDHIFNHLNLSCDLCKIQFRVKSRFARHMSKEHFLDMKNKKFKCVYCSEIMSSVDGYMKHVKQHCEYCCGLCLFRTPNHDKLTAHVKLNHSISEKDCADCLFHVSDDRDKLTSHILKITKENGFVCKFCGIGFHTEDFLKVHYEIYGSNHGHIVNEDTAPNLCSASAESTSQKARDLVKLPKKKGKSRSLYDRELIKLFRDIVDKKINVNQLPTVEDEVRGKGTVLKFQCPICYDKVYNTGSNLIPHVRSHLLQMCTECGRLFRDAKCFKRHMARHPGFEYKCFICVNVSFHKLSEYMSHISFHTVRKMCNYCSEVFSDGRKKICHMKRMHKDKLQKLICDHCGLSFTDSTTLKSHLFTHTGNTMKFICPDCGVKYSNRYQHRCSQKINTKEYICAYCSSVFRDKPGLISHIQVHMNLKTYECRFCKKCFNRQTSLQKHVKDMHSERKWKCTVGNCDKSFTYKSALETHLVKGHKCKVPK